MRYARALVILSHTVPIAVLVGLLAPFVLGPHMYSVYSEPCYFIEAPVWGYCLTGPLKGSFFFDTYFPLHFQQEFVTQMIPVLLLGLYYVIGFRREIVLLSTAITPIQLIIRLISVGVLIPWGGVLPIPTLFLVIAPILLLKPYSKEERPEKPEPQKSQLHRTPYIVYVLVLFSMVKVVSILVGTAWLEQYWIANPPRPDISSAVVIGWAMVDLVLALGLLAPNKIPWLGVLLFDLVNIVQYLPNLFDGTIIQHLPNLFDGITPFGRVTLPVIILSSVRVHLMFLSTTKLYYLKGDVSQV